MISVKDEIFEQKILFKKNYNLNKLLDSLKNPQDNFKVINVVGTNGKGSTSNFIFSGLKTKYEKVGLFTSPAFLYHNERIKFNNDYISDEDLKRILNDNKEIIKKFELTFFEIWTYIAILFFNEKKIDIAVIEAGIGGLKDSTNLFNNQIAVCVTSIDFDHTEILGNKIEEILFQKISIAKKGVPIFLSRDNYKYKKIINQINLNQKIYCKKINDPVYFQKLNKGLAKEVLKYLEIDFSLKWKSSLGRFTILKEKPFLILDGCHNMDGAKKLIKNIKNIKNIKIIFGSSLNKEQLKIIKILKKASKKIYLTEFEHPKSWEIDEKLYKNENIIKDWRKFYLNNKNENIIVCGSLYFIPIFYEWFKEID
ncbi:bifunctional folylpolyglutamate synthase/dihydrofolate synthase [Spiroplasma taiwanense]|uniref:tetrahydrofolate synthase n=1 Tax=Spiroplasma taiwanense CT-1 TaxID=1276220 RepID=S5LVZ3_9MOLU|nr:Mur ligase family protein [Spiroplasma taiwanense]AGR40761.1 folylpolyglutamate synthase [Spiroplasma taiwanense CT-1]